MSVLSRELAQLDILAAGIGASVQVTGTSWRMTIRSNHRPGEDLRSLVTAHPRRLWRHRSTGELFLITWRGGDRLCYRAIHGAGGIHGGRVSDWLTSFTLA